MSNAPKEPADMIALKQQSKGIREIYCANRAKLSTVEQEIVNLRHALLDLRIPSPGLVAEIATKATYPELIDVITNLTTILEWKFNRTPSLKHREHMINKFWPFFLKNVLWALSHGNVTDEQRKELTKLEHLIDTNRDAAAFQQVSGFLRNFDRIKAKDQ